MDNKISKYKKLNNKAFEKIAKKLSVTSQKVGMWEDNINNPNLTQSIIICDLFGITLDDLYSKDRNVLYFSHIDDSFRELIYATYASFIFINENKVTKYKKIIGKNNSKIKFQRKKYGFSQEKLAKKLDISRFLVRDWENNNAVPNLESIFSMSYLFDVSFDYFVNNNGVDELNLNRLTDEQVVILKKLIDYYSLHGINNFDKMNLKSE